MLRTRCSRLRRCEKLTAQYARALTLEGMLHRKRLEPARPNGTLRHGNAQGFRAAKVFISSLPGIPNLCHLPARLVPSLKRIAHLPQFWPFTPFQYAREGWLNGGFYKGRRPGGALSRKPGDEECECCDLGARKHIYDTMFGLSSVRFFCSQESRLFGRTFIIA